MPVKNRTMKIILYSAIILFAISCSGLKPVIQPTYNKGGYTLNKYSQSLLEKDSVVIVGRFSDLNGKENLVPATLKYGCITQRSSSGEVRLKAKASDSKVQLAAISIGYLTVETEPLLTQPGDSIIIHFYLAPDERPILNCEGNFKIR